MRFMSYEHFYYNTRLVLCEASSLHSIAVAKQIVQVSKIDQNRPCDSRVMRIINN